MHPRDDAHVAVSRCPRRLGVGSGSLEGTIAQKSSLPRQNNLANDAPTELNMF